MAHWGVNPQKFDKVIRWSENFRRQRSVRCQTGALLACTSTGNLSAACLAQEASPSQVYGAALLMRFGFTAHPGFKSPSLRPSEQGLPVRPIVAGDPCS